MDNAMSRTSHTTQLSSNYDLFETYCPAGKQYLTGSSGVLDGLGIPYNGPVALSNSSSVIFGNGHSVRAYETTSTNDSWYVVAYAICR
jgi:hypothetical protein